MKYQALKHNKTNVRGLGLFSTIQEAVQTIKENGAQFHGTSYMGGFPLFKDIKGKMYSIQGYAEPWGIVCSIPEVDLQLMFKD